MGTAKNTFRLTRAWLGAAGLAAAGTAFGQAPTPQKPAPVEPLTPPAAAAPVEPVAVPDVLPPVVPLGRTGPTANSGRLLQAAQQVPAAAPRQRDPSRRPAEPTPEVPDQIQTMSSEVLTRPGYDPPLGFAGPSSVLRRSGDSADFETVEDRWRIGFPEWNRSGTGYPNIYDSAYKLSAGVLDPYNLNWLKGDYPIYGQHTFLQLTGNTLALFEGRQLPTATTPFEAADRPFSSDFFGRPNSFLYSQFFSLSVDLFHGDQTAFKPIDWRIKLTPTFNVNRLSAQELAVINPDVREGRRRDRSWFTLQEWFAEVKLADLSPEYDFLSARVGSQPFNSDFRGFIFSDINRGARLFGNYNGNRDQFNLVYFRQLEKETNSGLNTLDDRNQNIVIANYYRQDFVFPGYTIQGSFHYNNDGPDQLFDANRFLARPDPVGVFQPHRVEAYYLGMAGDGHIDRFNVSHAFYWAVGRDSRNPIAGTPQRINAQMAACEVSYDRDWARFRVSGYWASGDGDPNNGTASGFDGILSNTNFAGEASFFNRQQIPLFGVGLTNRQSLNTSLRSSSIQGQSNFVNPGIYVLNFGFDADITPRLRAVNNVNFLWFDKTKVLETFVYQPGINRSIGTDISTLIEYRPLLNNNVILLVGAAGLIPDSGFRGLYNRLDRKVNALGQLFIETVLTY